MWRPITAAIDSGDTSGELSVVGPFLAAEAKRLTVKVLESMVAGQTFGK